MVNFYLKKVAFIDLIKYIILYNHHKNIDSISNKKKFICFEKKVQFEEHNYLIICTF